MRRCLVKCLHLCNAFLISLSTQTTSHYKSAFSHSHPHMQTLVEVTALHGDICSSEEANIHTCIHTLMAQHVGLSVLSYDISRCTVQGLGINYRTYLTSQGFLPCSSSSYFTKRLNVHISHSHHRACELWNSGLNHHSLWLENVRKNLNRAASVTNTNI